MDARGIKENSKNYQLQTLFNSSINFFDKFLILIQSFFFDEFHDFLDSFFLFLQFLHLIFSGDLERHYSIIFFLSILNYHSK